MSISNVETSPQPSKTEATECPVVLEIEKNYQNNNAQFDVEHLPQLVDECFNENYSTNLSTTSLSSFNDAISVDSAIHCTSVSSERSSITVTDKPTCRICLCTNDELDDDNSSIKSIKNNKKYFNKIKKTNNNLRLPKTVNISKSPFTNFDPNDSHLLITPCYCSGTLEYVHHKCLQQWIRTSSRQYCDMCRYHFKLHIKNKPFYMWECLQMTTRQKRRFIFHSLANIFAFLFVFWSTHVILDRAIHDLISHRRMNLRVWVKMLVIMFTLLSGFAFIYFQLKSFLESLMRLKRYNQIVIIENITKDTLQRVQSFKTISNIINDGDEHLVVDVEHGDCSNGDKDKKQNNRINDSFSDSSSTISSVPSKSLSSTDCCDEIVISIDATAHKIIPTHS